MCENITVGTFEKLHSQKTFACRWDDTAAVPGLTSASSLLNLLSSSAGPLSALSSNLTRHFASPATQSVGMFCCLYSYSNLRTFGQLIVINEVIHNNWGRFKGHWHYFNVVRQIDNSHFETDWEVETNEWWWFADSAATPIFTSELNDMVEHLACFVSSLIMRKIIVGGKFSWGMHGLFSRWQACIIDHLMLCMKGGHSKH